MKTLIAAGLLSAMIATAPAPAPAQKEKPWKDGGEWRITTYCYSCNDPAGLQSKSGKQLKYGYVAMNGVPLGTKISIDGEIFEVADRCGVDNTVDIFVEDDSGCCHCNTLEYKKVYIKEETK